MCKNSECKEKKKFFDACQTVNVCTCTYVFHILTDTTYTDKNIYANGTRHICVKLNTKYTMVT